MNQDRRLAAERIFKLAIEFGAGERAEFVDRQCGADIPLRDEVTDLLSHFEASSNFLDKLPPLSIAFDFDEAIGIETAPRTFAAMPSSVAGYDVQRVLGQGGMGTVYLAEQSRPRRLVALKVIKPELATKAVLQRFEYEADVLGRLEHSAIARIYDAGHSRLGHDRLPYFAMEYVEGVPITRYSAGRNLDVASRLRLVIELCHGVNHAHQKGVIHRDLKPANVFVDSAGNVKILDFGVARAAERDAATLARTMEGQLIGTLPYMSPEQVQGNPEDLDTRSDVYALGLISYELLTGCLPYDLEGKQLPEIVRIIAEGRQTPLLARNADLDSDLGLIHAKALAVDRAQRYQSALEFAADIERYLNDLPVTARRPGKAYLFKKFARRNRALVSSVTALLVVIIAGAAISTWLAVRATRAEDLANRRLEMVKGQRDRAQVAETLAEKRRKDATEQAAIANAVNDFLNSDLLGAVDPARGGRNVTVREVIDQAARKVERRFDDQPLVEAGVRRTMGTAYESLGVLNEAEVHYLRAVELQEEYQPDSYCARAETLRELGQFYAGIGRYDQAEERLTGAATLAEQCSTDDPTMVLKIKITTGALRRIQGDLPAANALLAPAVAQLRETLGEGHADTLIGLAELAALRVTEGKYEQASVIFEEVLSAQKNTLGADHPDTLVTIEQIADLHLRREENDKALALLEHLFNTRLELLGPEHIETIASKHNLAAAHKMLGDLETAERLYLEVLETSREALPDNHPQIVSTLNNLARLQDAQGRFEDAERTYSQALELRTALLGSDHPDTAAIKQNLAANFVHQKRLDEAAGMLEDVLRVQRRSLGDAHRETIYTMFQLGTIEYRLKRLDAADDLFAEAVEQSSVAFAPDSPWRGKYLQAHAHCLIDLKEYEASEEALDEAYPLLVKSLGVSDSITIQVARTYRRLYEAWPKPSEVEKWQTIIDESSPSD